MKIQRLYFSSFPTFPQLWDACMERYLTISINDAESLFRRYDISIASSVLDVCVGGGSFGTGLLTRGYALTTADGSVGMLEIFRKKLVQASVLHTPILASWDRLPGILRDKQFDAVMCCGNSLIYAGGYWNDDGAIRREQSLISIRMALVTWRELLKKGAVLFVDKSPDDEQPTEELVAHLTVGDGAEYDVFFSVRFSGDVRTAQILLRNAVTGEEHGVPNVAYRLKNFELEMLLRDAGFEVAERLQEGFNPHFPFWVARAV